MCVYIYIFCLFVKFTFQFSQMLRDRKAQKYSLEFSDLESNVSMLFCTRCSCNVSYTMRSQIVEHIDSSKHRTSRSKPRQKFLKNWQPYFGVDLCNAAMSPNIPFHKRGYFDLLLWISVDKTADVENRYVCNIIIGNFQPCRRILAELFFPQCHQSYNCFTDYP